MISFTQGDTAVLNLTATDGNGNPFDITAASFITQIKGPNGIIASFPNAQHSIVSALNGMFNLTLSSADTVACGLGHHKEIVTRITQGASVIYFRGPNILIVNPPVPLQ